MKTLAVGVPAYRRPALLQRCLESLLPQCHEHGIDVHVFDDACCDINRPVYEAFRPSFPNLRLHTNAQNLGIDRNIDQCISVPDARYVWMIGEDDLAAHGAVARILKVLDERRPAYLFVNYQYISNDYRTRLHVAVPQLQCGSREAGEFFRHHGWATGFLGANVVNKANWHAEERAYIGTYFSHVGKIFSAIVPTDLVEAVSDVLVYNRAESLDAFTWLDDCFEVNAGFGDMTERLARRHPAWKADAEAGLAEFMRVMNLRDLRSLLVLRALGVYSMDKYRRYMREQPLWPVYAAVAITPVPVLRPLYGAYRAVKSRLVAYRARAA